jgi:integrase
MARRRYDDEWVKRLKDAGTVPDPELVGHYIRTTPAGCKSFVVIARDPDGNQKWGGTIGRADVVGIDEAREKARAKITAIREGKSTDAPKTFKGVSDEWFKRQVEKRQLRSARNIRRYLDTYFLPEWGGRDFTSIRRGEVVTLLDKIEDECGSPTADKALSFFRMITTWHTARDENYVSPIVRGMSRVSTKERARKRVLSDDEIRALWSVDGQPGAFAKILLLTAQREAKVATMKWDDISEGLWTIPTKPREKSNAGELDLPDMALDIINEQPRFVDSPYVFSNRDNGPISAISGAKRKIDDAMVTTPRWTFHDLRRTARSLMARAGVQPDIAERVLGHTIQGVEGTYNRHTYRKEKAEALRKLAGLIERITNPQPNVLPLRDVAT